MSMHRTSTVAGLVRQCLQRSGESRTDFAQRANLHPSIVTRLLKPQPANVRQSTLDKVISALPPELRAAAKQALHPTERSGDRLRVFVSSTFLDQAERRKHVREAIERLGLQPIAMERFGARSQTSADTILEELHQADLYIGILAYRYGSIPPGQDRSYTEMEYDAAQAAGIDRLMFVVDRHRRPMKEETDADPLPDRWTLQGKLQSFVQRVSSDVTVAQFDTDAELVHECWQSLVAWLNQRGRRPTTVVAEPEQADAGPDAERISLYRDAMLSEHRLLPMVGFASTVRAPIQATALYVDLRARPIATQHFPSERSPERSISESNTDCIEVRSAFPTAIKTDRRCLALLGYAGSGKTTFLKRLAVACVQDGADEFGLDAQAVPILVTLRNLRDIDLQGSLTDIVATSLPPHFAPPEQISRHTFADWLVNQQRYPLLLLFDGLDEAPNDASRERLAKQIPLWLEQHKTWHVAVTSRIASYSDATHATLANQALELELQPFDDPGTERFIRNWYHIIECHYDADAGPARGAARAEDLIARLHKPHVQSSRVMEFTSNPLLLTIVCIIHRDSSQLPERRELLYREMLQVLLENWRRGKNIAVQMSAQQSIRVLRPVARFLHEEEGRTRATAGELAPVMADALMRGGWQQSPEQFLRAIRDDSGLLTGQSASSYGFLHLGIQEYLTALAIDHEIIFAAGQPELLASKLSEVASHYGEPWWREVILLLLALPDRPLFAQLFAKVVQLEVFGKHQDLLDDCIDQAAERDAKPFVDFLTDSAAHKRSDELRKRQLCAIRAIKRLAPAALDGLAGLYAKHSDADAHQDKELRAMLGIPEAGARSEAMPRTQVQAGGIEMVEIPAGNFVMGGKDRDSDDDEQPTRIVTFERPFLLARTPVTNAQYRAFVEATGYARPESWKNRKYNGDDQPVVQVSWQDAAAYCEWAGMRLPSEAEWEYACRAGTTTRFWSGDDDEDLARVGWYGANSEDSTRPVGMKPANPWGLFDMHGNVWEWCQDQDDSYEHAPTDGSALEAGGSGFRVLRGGSWARDARYCRSACRYAWLPGVRLDDVGFRPASSSL